MDSGVKSEIIDYYRKYFYTKAANTDELKEEAYKLRYKVYYEELDHTDLRTTKHQEIDAFDDYAVHSLLFYKPTNQLIACTRLVPFIKNAEINLPIESYCRTVVKSLCHSIPTITPDKLGEMSRFLIAPEFRCGYNSDLLRVESKKKVGGGIVNQSFLLMCMVLASGNLLREHNLHRAIAIMEPRLAEKLKRLSMSIEPIGESVYLHGVRKPYLLNPELSYKKLKPEYKKLFEIIKKEYKQSFYEIGKYTPKKPNKFREKHNNFQFNYDFQFNS